MSLKWLNLVWNTSKQKGANLLGLMAIADEATDEGIARPNIVNIAYKMRMNSRTAKRIIQNVTKTNELAVAYNPGYRSTYCILLGRPQEEIATIRKWLKLAPGGGDKLSLPQGGQIVTSDKLSSRFLINSIYINSSVNKLINPLSSSKEEDEDFIKILKAAGVWKRDIEAIRSSPISLQDFLAELARCYDDSKVRKPNRISVMNLLRGDRAPANWYKPEVWREYIPQEILAAGLPNLLENGSEVNPVSNSDYAKVSQEQIIKGVDCPNWERVKEELKATMPRAAYSRYVKPSYVLSYSDDKLVIASSDKEWMIDRIKITAERLLVGIANKPVSITFQEVKDNE